MKLTPKQAAFVREYLIDLNGKQAAIRAGYSAHTAESQGARLLGYAKVRSAVQEAMAKRAERTETTADEVLAELRRIAFADPRELVEHVIRCCDQCWPDKERDPRRPPDPNCEDCHGDGHEVVRFKDTRTLSPAAARLYAGVKWGRDGKEILLKDQQRALESLGKHLKLFTEKVEHEHKGTLTLEQLVAGVEPKPKESA